MPGGKRSRPAWIRVSSIGFEFAAAVAGFALVGYWIDRAYGTGPWGVLLGAILGIIGGTYNLIRQALLVSGDDNNDSTPRGNRHR